MRGDKDILIHVETCDHCKVEHVFRDLWCWACGVDIRDMCYRIVCPDYRNGSIFIVCESCFQKSLMPDVRYEMHKAMDDFKKRLGLK